MIGENSRGGRIVTRDEYIEHWGYPPRVPVLLSGIASIGQQAHSAAVSSSILSAERPAGRVPATTQRSRKSRSDKGDIQKGGLSHRLIRAANAHPGLTTKLLMAECQINPSERKTVSRAISSLCERGMLVAGSRTNGKCGAGYYVGPGVPANLLRGAK